MGPRILLVDDEPQLLKMMNMYMVRRGFSVTTASSTQEAWAGVEAAPAEVSVAVLDATMSGMSTQELALRILTGNPSASVIIASGYPVVMNALETAAPGRVTFLHKPFTAEMLVDAVRRMLGSEEKNV